MPGKRGSFLKYSEDAMIAAVENVLNFNTPIRTAAKQFGVPRITLKYKVDGKSPIERRMGPDTILTKEEETEVCRWVEKMAKAGFPVTLNELTVSMDMFIQEMKRTHPFKEGRTGKTWFNSFLRRNPSISKRISQNKKK